MRAGTEEEASSVDENASRTGRGTGWADAERGASLEVPRTKGQEKKKKRKVRFRFPRVVPNFSLLVLWVDGRHARRLVERQRHTEHGALSLSVSGHVRRSGLLGCHNG